MKLHTYILGALVLMLAFGAYAPAVDAQTTYSSSGTGTYGGGLVLWPDPPSVGITNPPSSLTLRWVIFPGGTNTVSCTTSGFTATIPNSTNYGYISGSAVVTPPSSASVTYRISCTDSGGGSYSKSVTVKRDPNLWEQVVPAPSYTSISFYTQDNMEWLPASSNIPGSIYGSLAVTSAFQAVGPELYTSPVRSGTIYGNPDYSYSYPDLGSCRTDAVAGGLSNESTYYCLQDLYLVAPHAPVCYMFCQGGQDGGGPAPSYSGGEQNGSYRLVRHYYATAPTAIPWSYPLTAEFSNATCSTQSPLYGIGGCTLYRHLPPGAPNPSEVTATLSANPPTVIAGGASALTWSSTNATSCTGTGFSTGGATSGTQSTGQLLSTQSYSVNCTGANGSAEASTTVSVNAATGINLTAGPASPTTATPGTSVTLSSLITNSGTLLTPLGFTNLFQIDSDADHTAVTATKTDTSPALAPSAGDTSQVAYTFPTAGTWYVRACADSNASWVGTITESNEADNCGPWTAVTVASSCTGASCLPGGGTLSCVAAPATLTAGDSSTWTASPSSLGTYTWTPSETGTPISGTQTLSRTYSSAGTYAMSVSAGGATASCTNSVTVGSPACGVAVPSISALPTRVQTRGTSTLTVSASGVDGTCTVTGPGVSQTISGSSCSVPSTTIPTGAITSLSTYTISCDSGEASSKVLVNVVPKIQEF